MHLLLKQKFKWIILLVLLAVAGNSQAQTITVLKQLLDGSENQVAKDSFVTVKDGVYFDPATQSKLDTPYQVKNIITFRINEAAVFKLPTVFTATVNVRIIYTRPDLVVDSIDKPLTINYSDTSTYTSRSSFVFNNAHKVTLKILSVSTDATSDILPVLVVENEMDVHPVYKLSCVGDALKKISFDTASGDQIRATWDVITGADVYDLEWTYIDSSALADNKYGNPVDPLLLFRNNATRVTLADNSYNIPLMYDNKGVLYCRVRAVQEKKNNVRFETAWSSADAGGEGLASYNFDGHERSLNWQSTINFAEEGKRKVVMQYYDGSLRSRQTVTKDNSTNTIVVGESLYDYQGRPVIQVMPAPTLGNVIKYSRNFNAALNGAEYDKGNYDTLLSPADFLTASANGMATSSGANQYYSPANPDKNNGFNQYIPDAGGFAFSETSYTQDNTGRISRQGGVGPVYRLGSNHEVKYSYGSPGENDLDVLFGTEVGDRSHYFKNMVSDANGQYAVSYLDMHGRTIATALAGTPDSANLENLESNVPFEVTDTLSGPGRNIVRDLVLESHQSQLVAIDADYHFKYALTPPVLQKKDCNDSTVCYKGLYDLEIKITDDAFNQRLGGKPFDTILHNYTIDTITADCSAPQPMVVEFIIPLKRGNYEITKRLTISRDAMAYYRDSIFMQKNLCTTLEQFIQQQRTLLTNTQCIPDCQSCRDSVGTWNAFQANYMRRAGITADDSTSYQGEMKTAYLAAIEACDGLCNQVSEINEIRNAMLVDVTASSAGQYANAEDTLDIYSIFYRKDEDTPAPYQRDTIHYLDAAGHIDSVYNETTNTYVLPQQLSVEQFTSKFKASWADSLLKFHPEYCKLIAYEQQFKSAINWGRKFEAVDTYAEARDSGYLNPTANNAFSLPIVLAGKDSLAMKSGEQAKLEAVMKNYNGRTTLSEQISIWRAATMTLKCTDSSTNAACYAKYSTDSSAFSEATMCTGDLDMAWRAFREMYLMTRTNIINDELKVMSCSGYSTSALLTAGKQLNFTNVDAALTQNNLDYVKGSSTAAKDSVNKALSDSYAANCKSYVSAWLSQLSACQFYDTAVLNTVIIPKLLNVCKEGADIDHPYGASTTKPGSTYTYKSFQDVMNEYNQQLGINDTIRCNAYLITAPLPYDKQRAYGDNASYAKPTDCECNKLHTLQTEYNAYKKPADSTFSAYIYRTRGVSLSTSQLDLLLTSCSASNSSCTYLATPVVIPALIQCNVAPPCASCSEVEAVYTSFTTAYPTIIPTKEETDTLQQKKNDFFAAYMNNRLGYSKEAWEYLAFRDTCAIYTSTDSSICTHPKNKMHSYTNGGSDIIYDVIGTSDNGYLLAGSTIGSDTQAYAYLIKTDSAGNVTWARSYKSAGASDFGKVKATSDGGYIAIGTEANLGDARTHIFIVKLTSNGNVSWSRRVGYNTNNGENAADIIQLSDSGYAFLGRHDAANTVADWLVGALSVNGDAQWIKRIGNTSGDIASSLLQNNDTLVLVGCTYTLTLPQNFDGVVIKLNRFTGAFYKVYQFDLGSTQNTSNYSGFIYKTPTGYMLNFANTAQTTFNSVLNISESGDIISAKTLSRPLNAAVTQWMPVTPTADGGLMAVQNFAYGSNSQISWHKINSSNTLKWSNWTMSDGGSLSLNKILQRTDAGYTGAGMYNNNALLMFTLPSGMEGCSDSTLYATYTTISASVIKTDTMPHNDLLSKDSVTAITITPATVNPTHKVLTCTTGSDSCYKLYNGPLLCGNAAPLFPSARVNTTDNCTDNEFFAVSKGTELFNSYRDSVRSSFEDDYINTALQAGQKEVFTVHYATSEYQYTLYYYDQAGNLVKTVPPAGVVIDRSDNWINRVKAAREAGDTLTPPHRMFTQYRYNTLGQVIAQQSPDAGTSKFWYDRLGRVAVSQNAKQALLNQYSYTTYDILGRISEVGEITSATAMTKETSRNATSLSAWIDNATASRTQITHTNYDVPYSAIAQYYLSPVNLRNRVSWSAIYNTALDQTNGKYAVGTFYSYDAHGNIDTLLQDYKLGGMRDAGNRFKKMVYSYDLISGKMNKVAYQSGEKDAFYHRYSYDAENRITNLETSNDDIYWENDAYYQYYKHGLLAKTIIGQQQVQGLDYAYTLQGWLKGVNSTAVTPVFDMGHDGAAGNMVAKDVFGFALHYYGNRDYQSVNSTVTPFASVPGLSSLFNGNISAISQYLPSLGNASLYSYNYDVLNRLKKMRVSNGLNTTTNTWTPVALPDYKESISYDANGNILTYNRYGNKAVPNKQMDSLGYSYKTGTNKLDFIKDDIADTNYDNDIDNQSAGNYDYDAIGNLVKDSAGSISHISWNLYGKIATITKTDGTAISYTYDVAGNRVSKTVNGVQTWYVRDATGNVMSVYTKGDNTINSGAISQIETHLYGSVRLGINTLNTNVDTSIIRETVNLAGLGSGFNINFIRGKKFFELSNHLGNVLATVSDRKTSIFSGNLFDHYEADIVSSQEYYSFGMQMPGRGFSSPKYRYGFNGKENDNEVKGDGNQQDYGMRVYDPRLGKFLSVDPLTQEYPWYTPYQFAGNTPIQATDIDGEEEIHFTLTFNKTTGSVLVKTGERDLSHKTLFSLNRLFGGKDSQGQPKKAIVTLNNQFTYHISGPENMQVFEIWKKFPQAEVFTQLFPSDEETDGARGENRRTYLDNFIHAVTFAFGFTDFKPVSVKPSKYENQKDPNAYKGGSEIRKEAQKISNGGGTPREQNGVHTQYQGNEHPEWRDSWEYEVTVPNNGNTFRILKQEIRLEGGEIRYRYGWTKDHYKTIYELKPNDVVN
ncbi:YD repeat-containing protein [Chitinophaga sp. YR573]|uniref:RHS repeat domain-containing protein n=1 Tax=Chitinophaga sp. YR573 TaxID=1881040 RepID=UPI0008D8015A|nr:RHS repeat-associated core domain-containing protein [Chitinophaga sp. YR573]SEW40115.1 YD repeat-containing protein [Chitinophaga sp. YR573]